MIDLIRAQVRLLVREDVTHEAHLRSLDGGEVHVSYASYEATRDGSYPGRSCIGRGPPSSGSGRAVPQAWLISFRRPTLAVFQGEILNIEDEIHLPKIPGRPLLT